MVERITDDMVESAYREGWKDANNSRELCHYDGPNDGWLYSEARAALQHQASLPVEAEGWQTAETAPTNRAILIHVPHLDYYGNDGVYAAMLADMGTGKRWMTFGWAIGRDLGAENAPVAWQAAAATCAELGRHTWVSIGGCNCACFDTSACSVPVHECTVCGDCDYGENSEANDIRAKCPCPEEYDAELRLALTAGSRP